MNKQEALKLLDNAPADGEPSRINSSVSRNEAVKLVRDWIETAMDDRDLDSLMAKRVLQVSQDRKRPAKHGGES